MLKKLLVKRTAIPSEIFGIQKITWEDDILSMEHYKELCMISSIAIQTKNYAVSGKELKIIFLDQYLLKISGTIEKVERRGTEHEL